MKAAICFPRLDVSFKKGEVPPVKGPPNHPIRYHWITFNERLKEYHLSKGDSYDIIEKPLWEFEKSYVEDLAKIYDVVYMPHKQKVDFNCGDNVLYYMQTVFPWLFTIDHKGWGANLSWLPSPQLPIIPGNEVLWNKLQTYVVNNNSKFHQPPKDINTWKDMEDYVLFVCQIPHDETIKYHSEFSVHQALQITLEAFRFLDIKVVVKSHPMNLASQETLRTLTKEYPNAKWVDHGSIHDWIRWSKMVFLVNSGVGFESMLWEQPILCYGRSEYSNFTFRIYDFPSLDYKTLGKTWLELANIFRGSYVNPQYPAHLPVPTQPSVSKYKYFITQFLQNCCFNGENLETFNKLEGQLWHLRKSK